ncbi:hypothetical protein [Microbacterium aurum]
MATEQTHAATITVDGFGYLSTGNLLIDRHAKRLINQLVEERFRCEVAAWAAVDTGRLRTRLAIRVEIAREFEILCAALGSWALVQGSELFPEEEFPSGDWWK